MKLVPEYVQYQDLFNKGYRFNPEEKTIFKPTGKDIFTVPEEFENWEIIEFDVHSYLNERLDLLGITAEMNSVELIDQANGRAKKREQFKIFSANEYGDIEILQYSLDREPYTFKTGETSAGPREEYYCQRRLNPQYADFCDGKYDYKDGIVTPFWHPSLLELYEAGEPVDTLTITEGQFKAWKAAQEGIPTVGLTSISHFRDRQTGKIHREILQFIAKCQVKKIVILWDGDCREVSTKDIERVHDLTHRPRDFHKYAVEIKELIKEFFPKSGIDYYFGTINQLEEVERPPKGIDDLLVFLRKPEALLKEYADLGAIPGKYLFFHPINTDNDAKRLLRWFHLDKVSDFYRFHEEKIKSQRFMFYGSVYELKDGQPVISIPADMKAYMRIGVSYYKKKQTPKPVGRKGETILEEILEPWSADAIKMDHGRELFHKIQRFEGFTNIPSHTNYQQIIDGHWNLYTELKHEKRVGDYPNIKIFLKHIFGPRFENGMILDYLTILYRFPMQKLPMIVLASEEQNTGKSTFINLVKMIFKSNMSIVSAKEFASDFTSNWISKLIVACEETMFEKQTVYEALKSLQTAEETTRNEKNKSQTDIPCMLHFIFATNHRDTFIKIDEHDSRFWIESVGTLVSRNPRFKELMREELPELIHDLETREIVAPETDRFWFSEESYKTEAFYDLVKRSEPEIVREMREHFRESFLKFKVTEIRMTANDIRAHFGIKGAVTWINHCCKKYFKVERTKNKKGEEHVTSYSFPVDSISPGDIVEVKGKGRPFVFTRDIFLTDQELNWIDPPKSNQSQLEL